MAHAALVGDPVPSLCSGSRQRAGTPAELLDSGAGSKWQIESRFIHSRAIYPGIVLLL